MHEDFYRARALDSSTTALLYWCANLGALDVLFSGKEEYFTPSQTAPTNKGDDNEASASVFSTPANVSQHNLLFNSVIDTTTSFFYGS